MGIQSILQAKFTLFSFHKKLGNLGLVPLLECVKSGTGFTTLKSLIVTYNE